ncbi:FKBP-type peptidyl-prolyl cis-trans isomerase, partial [Streptomyces griseus]|uniref:FKBP-type peptidyl-prolyl cis-trans isomerase n=1 Tax=Streptomyces griseus TaxID=1911 RepID=UPI0033E69135
GPLADDLRLAAPDASDDELRNALRTVGSRVLLVIPPDQAFGDQQQQAIPKNSTLVFAVDILAKV